MASVIQTVFALPAFQDRYFKEGPNHIQSCKTSPTECFQCQMSKIGDGLLSGRYSAEGFRGISPSMFKNLIGKGHSEFSTMRQQDAQEFLQHLLNTVEQKERSGGSDPSRTCRFEVEHRIQCLECQNVSYTGVDTSSLILQIPAVPIGEIDGKMQYGRGDLSECIRTYFESEMRELNCSVDHQKTTATFTQAFKSYPDFLFCVATRFVLGQGWVMEKLSKLHILILDVSVLAPLKISLDAYRASGLQPDETLFPESQVQAAAAESNVNQEALNQLMSMGFPEVRCKKALLATGNTGSESAMTWLFEHMEDAGS